MTHDEFVAAWRAGRVRIEVDPRLAGALVSQRLLLPFVAIAVIGLGIALVLWGSMLAGLAVGAVGILVPRLIKRGAAGFVTAHIAEDAELYDAAVRAGALRIIAEATDGK